MIPCGNQSFGTSEFVLAGFPNLNGTRVELFSMFLLIYLLTLTGNVMIVGVVGADSRLQTPMYFFLSNLSCLEILITSVIIPKMLSNFLSKRHTISFAACITQFYFYFFLGASEFLLLAVMSVDRYLAICRPLHYPLLMSGAVCFRVAVACWVGGLLPVLGPTVAVALLPFCKQGAVVQHFFCDSGPLLHLACTNTKKLEEADFVLASLVIVSSLMMTAASYGHIVLAVLRIPSASGRQKAFSTCTSHLMVVTLFYGSAIFLYVRPSQSGSVDTNWSVTVVTTFVTPLLNPFIYALRNDRVKVALKDMFRKVVADFLGHFLLVETLGKKTGRGTRGSAAAFRELSGRPRSRGSTLSPEVAALPPVPGFHLALALSPRNRALRSLLPGQQKAGRCPGLECRGIEVVTGAPRSFSLMIPVLSALPSLGRSHLEPLPSSAQPHRLPAPRLFSVTRTVQGAPFKRQCGSGGIRTHAPEETGALIQRLRPLGHATSGD
ncbi:olfactory receptor 6S1 [Nannospalax galili]|nr:olfactory receptor 6S1 [Nannospalax galili]